MAIESPARRQRARFGRIPLRALRREAAERALAFAVEAGASGAEELEDEVGIHWILYAPAAAAAAVRAAAERGLAGEGSLGAWRDEPEVDWRERWKRGLGPIEISPRLRLRPPFAPAGSDPARELVIEPGQAFGTGGHASTWLALAGLDRWRERGARPARVLDLGTGSGVLALAALRLFPDARAVACDLDPLACPAARANARRNGLSARLALFTGGVAALARARVFDCVVANLLRRELEPELAALAARAAAGACAVFSGLLEREAEPLAQALRRCGFARPEPLARGDADGERWIALLARRLA